MIILRINPAINFVKVLDNLNFMIFIFSYNVGSEFHSVYYIF